MKDGFSNLAAVCCEGTMAKSKELPMFMFSVDIVSAEKPQFYFVLGGREMGTRNIKNTEKRFGVTDWMGKTMVCSLHE